MGIDWATGEEKPVDENCRNSDGTFSTTSQERLAQVENPYIDPDYKERLEKLEITPQAVAGLAKLEVTDTRTNDQKLADSNLPKLTSRSLELFIAYAKDAGNWNGTPLVGGNVGGAKADQGNLTHLKQAGYITTHEEHEPGQGHCSWIHFTELGGELAALLGIEI